MTDLDKLIAEARRLENDYGDSYEVMTHMSALADALEAATGRARQAEAELRDMLRVDIPSLRAERDAAVAAKAYERAILDVGLNPDLANQLLDTNPYRKEKNDE